jgi:SAM-dependent methyltransferase
MIQPRWERHYHKDKSDLAFPDENLVRLLKSEISRRNTDKITAIDVGCGGGRHLSLCGDFGLSDIIGADASLQALMLCRRHMPETPLVQMDINKIPLKDATKDIVIAWGSLHYDTKEALPVMLGEIYRILRPGGCLLATVRSDRDTYLKSGKNLGNNVWQTDLDDINGSIAAFYGEDELVKFFSSYKSLEFGLMERTLLGDRSKIISHWFLCAKK